MKQTVKITCCIMNMRSVITSIMLITCLFLQATDKKEKFTAVNEQGFNLEFVILSESNKTIEFCKGPANEEKVIIPQNVDYKGKTYTVTQIGEKALSPGATNSRKGNKEIVIPSTIKIIGDRAFYCNKKLERINIPDGVQKIGGYAFWLCESLTDIYFPEGLVEIGAHAFLDAGLKTIKLPNSIKTIGEFAFSKWGGKPRNFLIENLPKIINAANCEEIGISRLSVEAYLAEHPRNVPQQPQVVYVQAPTKQQEPAAQEQFKAPSSDVDLNLPDNPAVNENTFAVIFANENYQEEVKVEYALNDGEMMRQYCNKVLGLPEDNIHFRKDATKNNMIAEISWMKKVADAYKDQAKFIVFYAGHGVPDEKTGSAYLLPVDGMGSEPETAYSLANFYKTLGSLPVTSVTIFMDACFSGSKRGEGMLASARGVAIKAKAQEPQGKMIVFSAAQGDETAYPLKDKEHGLFTYFLLKKLKETKGNVTLGELSSYVCDQVSKKSIVSNGKSQTPTISASSSIKDSWKTMKLK